MNVPDFTKCSKCDEPLVKEILEAAGKYDVILTCEGGCETEHRICGTTDLTKYEDLALKQTNP